MTACCAGAESTGSAPVPRSTITVRRAGTTLRATQYDPHAVNIFLKFVFTGVGSRGDY